MRPGRAYHGTLNFLDLDIAQLRFTLYPFLPSSCQEMPSFINPMLHDRLNPWTYNRGGEVVATPL